ncbi:TadE family protein [Arthrobacter sp. NPDC055585]
MSLRSPRSGSSRRAPGPGDEGSAVVDFVLVGALLTILVLAVIQLAVVLHVRNTLIDAASSGARYGTLADRNPEDGVERTRQLISGSLNAGFAQDISHDRTSQAGSSMLKVTVRAPLPVIGLIGPQGGMEVTGHAYWPE